MLHSGSRESNGGGVCTGLSRAVRDGEGVARVWQAGVSEASIEVVW
jgi:hypothetical protein